MDRLTLPKTERLHSRKTITKVFGGGKSRGLSSFPLRAVFMPLTSDNDTESGAQPCQMLVSVPKRCLHRANKRNRVKRQVREAYRKHKSIVEGLHVAVAFIWLDQTTWPSDKVEHSVKSLLTRIAEKMERAEMEKMSEH